MWSRCSRCRSRAWMGMCFVGDDLLITADGWLLRYRDADGDGRADGPPEKVVPLATAEHGGHAMRKGPDGWIHAIGGNDAGIDVRHVGTSDFAGRRAPSRGGDHPALARPEDPVRSPPTASRNPKRTSTSTCPGDLFISRQRPRRRDENLPCARRRGPSTSPRGAITAGGSRATSGASPARPTSSTPSLPSSTSGAARRRGLSVIDTPGSPIVTAADSSSPTGPSAGSTSSPCSGRLLKRIQTYVPEVFLEPRGSDGFAPTDLCVAPDGASARLHRRAEDPRRRLSDHARGGGRGPEGARDGS